MSEYVPTIGLEIHAELKTQTKMFCSSKNDADATEPNVNICPVCMAHPGTLPVVNYDAVRHVLRVGVALGSKLADYTEFDRKNYFYPDLPKGYQLSQYEYPLVAGGELSGVEVTRVHLEEDTASSMHTEDPSTGSISSPRASSGQGGVTTIDYNRAGVPLMELVTEPVIRSSKQAGDFARELQTLLRYLGASEANMEKGQMRVEANVSVSKQAKGTRLPTFMPSTRGIESRSPLGGHLLGTKVEIKNLNSFRAMERAVEYEIRRQTAALEKGEVVVQETRGWDESKQATFAQRTKEGSADYRYFPDPDLPSLKLSELPELSTASLSATMPELPWERRARYLGLGIKSDDAQLYVQETVIGDFFEEVIGLLDGDAARPADCGARILLASNYIANDLVKIVRDVEKRDSGYQSKITISAENFKKIIDMVADKKISSRTAKDLLVETAKSGRDPEGVAKSGNLYQVSAGGDFEAVVMDAISKNPTVVHDFKSGKAAALEYLVGQCMKTLRGAGDAEAIRKLLKQKLA